MLRPVLLLGALTLPLAPLAAQESCALCRAGGENQEQPVAIEIFSGLTFSRLALTGDGQASAEIDPQTGEKRTSGGIVNLGGSAVQGRGRITGTPGRAVRVDLPSSVIMTSTTGGTAELTDFVTDLPSWPVLDAGGSLEFSFGGKLRINGPIGGNLRGRIPISVDYN